MEGLTWHQWWFWMMIDDIAGWRGSYFFTVQWLKPLHRHECDNISLWLVLWNYCKSEPVAVQPSICSIISWFSYVRIYFDESVFCWNPCVPKFNIFNLQVNLPNKIEPSKTLGERPFAHGEKAWGRFTWRCLRFHPQDALGQEGGGKNRWASLKLNITIWKSLEHLIFADRLSSILVDLFKAMLVLR